MSPPRLCLIVLLALGGCTYTRPLGPTEVDLQAARARTWPAATTLTLASGERARARALHVAPDVTTWIDPETGAARSAPTGEVVGVQLKTRARGAFEGVGIGAVVGTAVGFALGFVATSVDWVGKPGPEYDRLYTIGFTIYGAMFGTATGGAAGFVRGSRTEYVPLEGGE